MNGDGTFFLGVLGFFFVLWLYTGGPTRPISFAGIYITPITGIGQTQVGYGPQINIKGLFSRGSVSIGSASSTAPANDSPYSKLVTIARATGAASVPSGYLQILVSPSAGKDVDITGWKIESTATGASATVPTGALLFRLDIANVQQEILLRPGDKADITSGVSPVKTSLEENKCIGYLMTSKQSLYTQCLSQHVKEPGFLTGTWYAYLNRATSLWNTSHDSITVLDAQGKTVGSFTY